MVNAPARCEFAAALRLRSPRRHPLRHDRRRDLARRDHGGDLALLGWQRDLSERRELFIDSSLVSLLGALPHQGPIKGPSRGRDFVNNLRSSYSGTGVFSAVDLVYTRRVALLRSVAKIGSYTAISRIFGFVRDILTRHSGARSPMRSFIAQRHGICSRPLPRAFVLSAFAAWPPAKTSAVFAEEARGAARSFWASSSWARSSCPSSWT